MYLSYSYLTITVLLTFIPVHCDTITQTINVTNGLGSTVICPSNIPCIVNCNGEDSCRESTILCPDDSFCNVQCNGVSSCHDAFVTNDKGNHSMFTVTCIGNDSCRNAVIDAVHSDQLLITGCSDPGSCIGMTLFCPSSLSLVENGGGIETAKCIIIDGNEFGGTEQEPLTLYAINGFLDLNITGTAGGDIEEFEGTMYCTADYNSSCDIDIKRDDASDAWQCIDNVDGPSICDNGMVDLVHFNSTISNLESMDSMESEYVSSHCNHSLPFCVEISFDYLIVDDLGLSKYRLDSILYNITTDFVDSEILTLSEWMECGMNHHDVIHSDFLSAVLCFECDHIDDAINVNVSTQSLNALATSFASMFDRGTNRLMLLNGSTEIEMTLNHHSNIIWNQEQEEEEEEEEEEVVVSDLRKSSGYNLNLTKLAMICGIAFALIMTLCWMKYMLQRKPRLKTSTAGGVTYARGHDKSSSGHDDRSKSHSKSGHDDNSLSGRTNSSSPGSSPSTVPTKGIEVPEGSDGSSQSGTNSSRSGGSSEETKASKI